MGMYDFITFLLQNIAVIARSTKAIAGTSDEAIQGFDKSSVLDCFASPAMTRPSMYSRAFIYASIFLRMKTLTIL